MLNTQPDVPSVDLDASEPRGGGLRLVRLRLVLALLATAILPLAIVAPVQRFVSQDRPAANQAQLLAEARAAASSMSTGLEGMRRAVFGIADAPGTLAALKADKKAIADAGKKVTQIGASNDAIQSAALVGPDGSAVTRAAGMPAPTVPSAVISDVANVGPGGFAVGPRSASGDLIVAMPVLDGSRFAGAVVLDLSLDTLIKDATPSTWTSGMRLVLADPSKTPAFADDSSTPISLDAVGFGGWTVVVSDPSVITGTSPVALLVLGLSILAVVVLVAWMALQVLRPAAQLEASRSRLHTLYTEEREVSLQDSLTGLGNHRAFQEELSRQFDVSNRYHVALSVLVIDLDEFKQVNDTLGHAVGDDLLAEAGRIMRSTIRTADRAFRTGGDEFAIVLPHTEADGALEIGERLLHRLLEDRSSGRYRRPISFSGGIASTPKHGKDKTTLLGRADAALYRSKRHGRTTLTVFDASVDTPTLTEAQRAELSTRVAKVVSERALTPVYQPIVHLETGKAVAHEGLVRPAPGTGFDSPSALFAAAEITGRITDLDRACLEVVVAGAREVSEDTFISLNISPRTFEAPEFSAAAFLKILERYKIAPSRVILELTEREAIQDLDRLSAALQQCRSVGVRVAADDVGAGNAGLRLLSQIQFDVVKVDLSLVQAGAGREPVASVLGSLVELARRWRALIVAEGVETPEQLRLIRNLGISAAQGYLLARPGPIRPSVTYDIEELASQGRGHDWAIPAFREPLGIAS